jgi:hypothetical protein
MGGGMRGIINKADYLYSAGMKLAGASDAQEVDSELITWIKSAFEGAG